MLQPLLREWWGGSEDYSDGNDPMSFLQCHVYDSVISQLYPMEFISKKSITGLLAGLVIIKKGTYCPASHE